MQTASPTGFTARQVYSPASSGNTSVMAKLHTPSVSCIIVISLPSLIGLLSWYHSTLGVGFPWTMHVRFALSPSMTLTGDNRLTNVGETSSTVSSHGVSNTFIVAVQVTDPPTFSARQVYVPANSGLISLIMRIDLFSCVTILTCGVDCNRNSQIIIFVILKSLWYC